MSGTKIHSLSAIPPPDSNVTRLENEFISKHKGLHNSGKSKDDGVSYPATRPFYGSAGKEISLWTNHFPLSIPKCFSLYRYSIASEPPATGKKMGQVVHLLLEKRYFSNITVVTDYRENLYSTTPIDQSYWRETIKYRNEMENQPQKNAREYIVSLQENGVIDFADLLADLQGSHKIANCTTTAEILQALTITLIHQAKSSPNMTAVGSRRLFIHGMEELNNTQKEYIKSLTKGLTAIRGFFLSARAATGRILVNANVTHGTFYQATGRPDQRLNELHKFLRGLRVELVHIPKEKNKHFPRIKIITGLASKCDRLSKAHPPIVKDNGAGPNDIQFNLLDRTADGSMPELDDPTAPGHYVTVAKYFRDRYPDFTLTARMHVVNLGSVEKPSYFPADVCVVLPGQPYRRKLDEVQMKQMGQFAVREPNENAKSIDFDGHHLMMLHNGPGTTLNAMNVTVQRPMITVPARQLDPPNIEYANGPMQRAQSGGWNMRGMTFKQRAIMPAWGCLRIFYEKGDIWAGWAGQSEDQDETTFATIIQNFRKALDTSGLNMQKDSAGSLLAYVLPPEYDLDHHFKKAYDEGIKFLLVVLPKQDTQLYDKVKKLGDIVWGIHTVCVIGSAGRFFNPHQSKATQYFANVALKINIKLGGVNHSLAGKKLEVLEDDRTMIIGIDVTHPSPGSKSTAPSAAAMVSNVDSNLAQWPVDLRLQRTSKDEMVSELSPMLKTRLDLWKKNHQGQLPDNLLIFRDGVSEGRYQQILEIELARLRSACKDYYLAQDLPKITLIIVAKRHHTRFFPTKENEASGSNMRLNNQRKPQPGISNPKNGTVVDRGVTDKRTWDFYLQSHHAIQGTARPAHYVVMLNEIFQESHVRPPNKNVADLIQDITHNLCYMYGRATKAVSICTPTYYADIACERARRWLSDEFAPVEDTPPPSDAGDFSLSKPQNTSSTSSKAAKQGKDNTGQGSAPKAAQGKKGQAGKPNQSQQQKKAGGQAGPKSGGTQSSVSAIGPTRNERGETRFEERERIAKESAAAMKKKMPEAIAATKQGTQGEKPIDERLKDISLKPKVEERSSSSPGQGKKQQGQQTVPSSSAEDKGAGKAGESVKMRGEKEKEPEKKDRREGEEPSLAMKKGIQVHENLKDTMFYL